MEKNCRAHIKVEANGPIVVYHRCLEDMVGETGLCLIHLAKKIVEDNDRVISFTKHDDETA